MSQEELLANPTVTPSKGTDNVWRVNKSTVELTPGETVTFDPVGLEARLWIPHRNIFETSTEVTPLNRKPVTLRVSKSAQVGDYPYGFYLMGKNKMVEGNSPPYIRIKKSTLSRGGGDD